MSDQPCIIDQQHQEVKVGSEESKYVYDIHHKVVGLGVAIADKLIDEVKMRIGSIGVYTTTETLLCLMHWDKHLNVREECAKDSHAKGRDYPDVKSTEQKNVLSQMLHLRRILLVINHWNVVLI